MFNVGPTELIVILLIALIVFGPKRLPEVGRTVGKSLTEFRKASSDIRKDLSGALKEEPPASSTAGHIAPAGKSKENAFNLSSTMVRFVTATENSGTVHGREDESRVFGAFDFCGDDIIKKTAGRGQVWRAAPRRGPLMIWLPANVQILGGMNHEDYSCV